MKSNSAAHEQGSQVLVPNYRPQPITLVRGEGCRLWDAEGKSYLDLMGGIATAALGHCHPAVVAALSRQSESLWHVSNLYSTEPQLDLAMRLIEHSFGERVFFSNSGAEANEAALKLARRHAFMQDRDHGGGGARNEIVAFDGSFHGRTLFTVTATGQPAYREGFEPVVPGVLHAPFGDLDATRKIVGSQTAAILVEPIQGEGGVRPATREFLAGLRNLADANGCLLIFDEIQTGMGRTGTLFAYEQYDVVPDIMTLAKALGNGIPIGATLTTTAIAEALTPGTHGSTFGGNPLATACGAAVMRELTEGGVIDHAAKVGAYLGDCLDSLAERFGADRIVDSRGVGLLRGLELNQPVAPIVDACRERGVLIISAGPNTLRFAPPLIIQESEIDSGLEVLTDVLSSTF
jgi:acetylornithine/N-succinyldiaminopimelate aminotransferase